MPDEPAALAIDGGAPLRSEPWPAPLEVEPAPDADPIPAVEVALAAALDLPPACVVAYASAAEAYRAAFAVVPTVAGRDEIVAPALLAEAPARVAIEAGWRVVPADVETDTGALSARGLTRAAGERAAGVLVVHAFGHPALMPDLQRSASERGLAIVEDITGALGASFRGTPAGRMSHRAVFTGRPGDPVSRGAFAIFASAEEAEQGRAERSGVVAETDARVALAELRRLQDELTERRRLAWELRFNMRRMKGVDFMQHGKWVQHAYPLYAARLRSTLWKRPILETVAALRAEGVPCELACPAPLHHDAAVRAALPDDPRLEEDALTVAMRLSRELIAIPLHSNLTSKDMDTVAAVLQKLEARSL